MAIFSSKLFKKQIKPTDDSPFANTKPAEEVPTPTTPLSTPKTKPARGAGGKFVSKKTPEELAVIAAAKKAAAKPEPKKEVIEPVLLETSEPEVTEPEAKPGMARSKLDEEILTTAEPETAKAKPVEEELPEEDNNKQPVSIFYGCTIRKVYAHDQWYFALEDILPLMQYNNPHKALTRLMENEDIKKVIEKVTEENENVAYISRVGFMELLPLLRNSEHVIPGPFPDWLAERSSEAQV